jgi:hypothetical protein
MFDFYDTNLSYCFTFRIWRVFLRFDWWYDVGMRKHKRIPLESQLTLLAADKSGLDTGPEVTPSK